MVDEDNHLVGVISEKDILKSLLPGYTEFLENPDHALDFQAMEHIYGEVLDKRVEDLMSHIVYSISIDEPVMKAAVQMELHHFRRIPVVGHDKRLAGIVSLSDIHHALFMREMKGG